jgi:hypothetical protein
MHNAFAKPLEDYIDRTSLSSVLNLLSAIADEKAEHIRTNWQDSITAAKWDKAADKLAVLAATLHRQNL